MRVVKRILTSNWFLISVGLILTAKAVESAYFQRGYIAFGGEWLVIPFMFVARAVLRGLKEAVADVLLYGN